MNEKWRDLVRAQGGSPLHEPDDFGGLFESDAEFEAFWVVAQAQRRDSSRKDLVREIAKWLMHVDRLDDIPGARAGLPGAHPLWDAGVKLAERYGVEL